MISLLKSRDLELQQAAAKLLRSISVNERNRDRLARDGAISVLVKAIATTEDFTLKLAATASLWNLSVNGTLLCFILLASKALWNPFKFISAPDRKPPHFSPRPPSICSPPICCPPLSLLKIAFFIPTEHCCANICLDWPQKIKTNAPLSKKALCPCLSNYSNPMMLNCRMRLWVRSETFHWTVRIDLCPATEFRLNRPTSCPD